MVGEARHLGITKDVPTGIQPQHHQLQKKHPSLENTLDGKIMVDFIRLTCITMLLKMLVYLSQKVSFLWRYWLIITELGKRFNWRGQDKSDLAICNNMRCYVSTTGLETFVGDCVETHTRSIE
jgi:hypothetical protein